MGQWPALGGSGSGNAACHGATLARRLPGSAILGDMSRPLIARGVVLGWAAVLFAGCTAAPTTPGRSPAATAPTFSTPAAPTSAASSPPSGPAPSAASPSTQARSLWPTSAAPITVAARVKTPWDLGFLPDGTALVTLRDAAQIIALRPTGDPEIAAEVPDARPSGEGGLLGLAVSPSFSTDGRVFIYYTSASDNRVERMLWQDGRLVPDRVILQGIPKGSTHNGGRLRFGPDGYLYIGTGDSGTKSTSQDRENLGGKILRVTVDGKAPADNPWPANPVWSLGHRNVQGFGWDGTGRMFASEFGQNDWDEVNVIVRAGNYGWPGVEGKGGRAGFIDPIQVWKPADASPSGVAVTTNGTVYVAGLRGARLWRLTTAGGAVTKADALVAGQYGRLRHVEIGPDGRLWLLTSNISRGNPTPADDRVIILPT